MRMRWLVTGAEGMLGRDLVEALGSVPDAEVRGVDRGDFDITDPSSVQRALREAVGRGDVVVNCAAWTDVDGAEEHEETATLVNGTGAGHLATACGELGARLVQISTDYVFAGDATVPYPESAPHAPLSASGRSKAAGEKAVLAAVPSATILRPSVVFGPEDQFTNRFAALARISPMLPLIGGGVTRMQPVYVGDVATAVADAVDGKAKPGATYELGGPEVLTLREIMQIILAITERRRMMLSLPFGLAKFQSHFLQFAPGPLKLTPDQVLLLQSDNVVSPHAKAAALTLEGLGITPDSLEAIAPQYLWRFRKTGQFAHKGT